MQCPKYPSYLNATPHILCGIAMLVLAYEPVLWLINTWRDPSYDSHGFIVFAICAGLFVWSVTSRKTTCRPVGTKISIALLLISACVRLIGQVMAINMIGALTLVVDVYAVSRLCGVHVRKRPLSPFWLAVCFMFSLPLERVIQRIIGYGLQHLSATGACGVLGRFYGDIECFGVRLLIDTQDVLIDLPCSGARSLLLLFFFYAICTARGRFKFRPAILGGGMVLLTAYTVNVFRICILAIGIVEPEKLGGIDVMAQPWHDLIGLTVLMTGSIPIIIWSRYFTRPVSIPHPVLDRIKWNIPTSIRNDGWWLVTSSSHGRLQTMIFSLIMLGAAVGIISLPRHAIDVARAELPLTLPPHINGEFAEYVPLSDTENAYFKEYGGSALKASYGEVSLMLVRTSAPLRHLHTPDECLRGMGMAVEYKGLRYDPLPSAIYKATDGRGTSYRIAVSFFNQDHSIITTNVATAVWYWMQLPGSEWTAIQRISPWDHSIDDATRFDYALMAALDIGSSSTHYTSNTQGERYETN